MPQPVFEIEGLTKTYRTGDVEVQALRGVDATLYEGELAVMLGPSGSGKSTFLNILGGLDTASAGSARFRGRDLAKLSERELTLYRRDHVGFVFQFYNLIPSLTAKENVALVTEISAHPMRPEEALELVGLKERIDHFPAQLSGGEQQRVAIARAVAKRPEVLLCDEPTGALDSQTGVLVLQALEATNRDLGTTDGDHHPQCLDRRHGPPRLLLLGWSDRECRRERGPCPSRRDRVVRAMHPLDIKLFRDLRQMWAQALAIALVMACGVATLILAVGAYRSLDETRSAYYERYRFGDVFASAVRAPEGPGQPDRGH